jgi:hypothetical protein
MGYELALTSSASGTSFGMLRVAVGFMAGDGGIEMRVSQGLGTRGLSDWDSPNMQIYRICGAES